MKIKRQHRGKFLVVFAIYLLWTSCRPATEMILTPQEVALHWADLTLYITKNTPANSPTFASRAIGYIGLTMYESIVHGYPSYQSVAGQLNGLGELPQPEANAPYDWVLALNAGQAEILRTIYIQTSDSNKTRIDELERQVYETYAGQLDDPEVGTRSAEYGKSIADAIFEWSKTDGGHRGYLHNFDKELTFPQRPGGWVPPLYGQAISHYPLHPHWGENRTFLKENSDLPIPYMIPYDTMPGSPYYEQYNAVYQQDKILNQDEKEQALWWGDDPDVTFTPPGHSYYIATKVIRAKNPDVIVCAEAFAKVGMAVADAFINCWKWKYHYFSERPNTFIPKFIDPEFVSFWPDPPFPAFPSGHAINAAAAATVLKNEFGPWFHFIDSSHYGRPFDEFRQTAFVPQSFDSFWQVAIETADSRFFGGIHTHQDNDTGMEQGALIAENVNHLHWKKENAGG
ncbi:MAG: vanadium-dependent haloperoxidase [Saprospiraceae bacterium]